MVGGARREGRREGKEDSIDGTGLLSGFLSGEGSQKLKTTELFCQPRKSHIGGFFTTEAKVFKTHTKSSISR